MNIKKRKKKTRKENVIKNKSKRERRKSEANK